MDSGGVLCYGEVGATGSRFASYEAQIVKSHSDSTPRSYRPNCIAQIPAKIKATERKAARGFLVTPETRVQTMYFVNVYFCRITSLKLSPYTLSTLYLHDRFSPRCQSSIKSFLTGLFQWTKSKTYSPALLSIISIAKHYIHEAFMRTCGGMNWGDKFWNERLTVLF